MRCLEEILYMTYFSDRSLADHRAGPHASGLEPEFMIDQREHARIFRSPIHLTRPARVHRHGFFTQDVFPVFDGQQCHFPMQFRRSRYADEVDVITGDRLSPISREMRDSKLLRGRPRILDRAARNGYDLGPFARLEGGYLYPARETGANNAYSNCHSSKLLQTGATKKVQRVAMNYS